MEPRTRRRSTEEKFLKDRRSGELGVKKYAAKNNERDALVRWVVNLLEEVCKANPSLLQELGPKARCTASIHGRGPNRQVG